MGNSSKHTLDKRQSFWRATFCPQKEERLARETDAWAAQTERWAEREKAMWAEDESNNDNNNNNNNNDNNDNNTYYDITQHTMIV